MSDSTRPKADVNSGAEATPTVPVLRVIARLVRNQPVRYPASLVAWITVWTMPVLLGLIAARFFDALVEQDAAWDVPTVVVALVAYIVGRVAVVFVAMRVHAAVLFHAAAGMKQNLLTRILSLPGAQPVDESSGEVVSRFRDDVEHTVEAFDFSVDMVGSVVSTAVAVAILVRIDPVLTVTVFAPLVAVILVTARLGTRIRRYRTASRRTTEAITGFLGETLGAVQAVKVADKQDPVLARFEALGETRRRMAVRDRTFTAALEAVFHNTVSIGTGVILVMAAGTLASPAGLTIGEFALFVALLGMVTDSAFFAGLFLARMKQAGVSLERMVALMSGSTWHDLAAPRDLQATVTPRRVRTDIGARADGMLLSVRDLSYRHAANGHGVAGIDLDIAPGQLVVVTGRIGSGKTTLLRTILGLLPADAGEVRWRGEVVDDPATFLVPPRTAYTPQVPRLFSLTLRDNLLLGHDATQEDLDAAMATATLTHDVAAMADGYDTLVGPRGVRLSGGQVQRSAAARMLVRTPELLVFDDLSSALDVETEAALWDGIFDEPGRATALVVSHRRPALHRADQVIVLEDGRVTDRGTAAELLARSRTFRDLWGATD